MLSELSPDGRLLFASSSTRSFAYGFVSVVLALYLAALHLSPTTIGAIFTVSLAGGAAMTIVLTAFADRLGRRRVLQLACVLMALAGAVFALTDKPLLLAAAAIVGTMSPSGKELGPFLPIEQAVLPQTVDEQRRTSLFAAYNLVSSFTGALGALAAGLPAVLGLAPLTGVRALLWAYSCVALALFFLYSRLSPAVEVAKMAASPKRAGLHRSRAIVIKLAALFAVDSFAGGFAVQGLLAYWFHVRYGVDTKVLGAIFFGTNLCAALSFLAAAPLARRFGLLNTMVFTHLPSNVLLVLVPFMPNLWLAVGVLLLRFLLSQLDVPTRQSYTVAVVDPSERAAAAGITSVARNAATALAPIFSGATLAVPVLGLPFLIAGTLKIGYDLAIFAVFRGIKPPEEEREGAGASFPER
jgi:MFS family permease